MERIGTYEVVRMIALGGTATVYEARQPALDRTVALKRLDLRSNDPVLVERFIRESRIAASFDHPNIVTVHDFFECDGVPYIAMEYLRRGSLRPWVRHVSTAQAISALEGILAALRHAERRGIVHRDLKPENVLLTQPGGVKIADFGIAKAYTRATPHITSTGTAVGTPAYMAPEQALGRQVGPFTDLYAVGVMAFEFFSGAPPFAETTSVATLYRHVNEAPPPLADLQPDVDPAVAAWVARLLEKDPADRPASAREAWGELEEVAVSLLGPFWRRDALIDEASEPTETQAVRQNAATRPAARAPSIISAGPTTMLARPGRRRAAGLLAAAAAAVALAGVALAELGRKGGTGARDGQRAASTPATAVKPAIAPYDFRGDGHAAIVAGMPGWRPAGGRAGGGRAGGGRAGGGRAGGGVAVLGSPGVITERQLDLPGVHTSRDGFGAALASGDFNGDGRADLAIGAPGHNSGSRRRLEGAVTILRGTAAGLGRTPVATFSGPGADLPYRSARYGTALAAGDLDDDGYADLVVGAPGGDARPAVKRGSGAMQVLFGSAAGLSRSRARSLRRPGNRDGRFGHLLRLGDLDRDGHLDIVEAAPGDPTSAAPGHASYCRGGPAGPTACRTMGTGGVAGPASLAVGDVTGDGYPDVVHGVPGSGPTRSGAVLLWPGTPRGPSLRPLAITQQTRGIAGVDQLDDRFGSAVALADIDRDGFSDLLVGAPGEDQGSGLVTLIFGGRDLHAAAGAVTYAQGQGGTVGRKAPGARFGATLQVLDTNGDRRTDLVVGAPGDGGALVTLPGIDAGFSRARASMLRLARLPGGRTRGELDIRLGG